MRMISRLFIALAARDRIARRSVRPPGRYNWCRSSLLGFDDVLLLLRAAVVRRLSSSVLSVGALTIPIRGGMMMMMMWDADGSERVFDRVVVVVHLEERRTRLQKDPVDVIVVIATMTTPAWRGRRRRRRHDDDDDEVWSRVVLCDVS